MRGARFRHLKRDERGISAVVAAIAIVGLFGALVFSLDAGNLWASKRSMVTATDAGALIGATTAKNNAITTIGPCPQVVLNAVTTQLTANQPTATLDACNVFPTNAQSGYITVDARKQVSTRFAGIFGFGDQSAFSSTSVAYGFCTSCAGLRPTALCVGNDHVQEWINLRTLKVDAQNNTGDASKQTAYQNALNNYNALPTTDPTNHPTYAGAGVVHRIFFNKANARGCGADAAAGNWGMIDFENGANGACLNNDMQYGYFGNLPTCNVGPGEVGIYGPDPVATPCPSVDDLNGCVAGNTGSPSTGQGGTGLDYLKNNGIHFVVPLFGAPTTNGSNTIFPVKGFIGMRLWDYKITGASDGRYLDVEFLTVQLQGKCCGSSAGNEPGIFTTVICSTDHDPVAASTRCTPS